MKQRFYTLIRTVGMLIFAIVRTVGIAIGVIGVGIPALVLLFITLLVLLVFIPLDIPIWVLSGKTPITYLISKIDEVLP